MRPTKHSESQGCGGHANIDRADQFLTIDPVGDCTGGQCEQKERQ